MVALGTEALGRSRMIPLTCSFFSHLGLGTASLLLVKLHEDLKAQRYLVILALASSASATRNSHISSNQDPWNAHGSP